MPTKRTPGPTMLIAAAVLVAALATPGLCVESQLAGVSLGDTPEEVLADPGYGPPDAMFTPGNVFNDLKAPGRPMPVWARAVQMAGVDADQVQWLYNRDPAAVGLLMTGTGINARVTNIVVSMWKRFEPSKIAETTEGIRLGDTFADVLETYGWPNRMEITSEAGAGAGARAGTARPTVPGAEARRPLLLRRGEEEEEEELGLRGAVRRAPGPLPRVGPAPAQTPKPTGPVTAATAAGPGGPVTFTKSCILSYPTVDFVIYRMTVFRIHIYGR